jgi:hypothetical protein
MFFFHVRLLDQIGLILVSFFDCNHYIKV